MIMLKDLTVLPIKQTKEGGTSTNLVRGAIISAILGLILPRPRKLPIQISARKLPRIDFKEMGFGRGR